MPLFKAVEHRKSLSCCIKQDCVNLCQLPAIINYWTGLPACPHIHCQVIINGSPAACVVTLPRQACRINGTWQNSGSLLMLFFPLGHLSQLPTSQPGNTWIFKVLNTSPAVGCFVIASSSISLATGLAIVWAILAAVMFCRRISQVAVLANVLIDTFL